MAISGRAGGQVRRRAKELLTAVGLKDRAHHRLAELSGGEQQRVALAVALANLAGQEGDLLLADEPTGELDSSTARDIYQIFRNLSQTYGLTTVIVSHDMGIARHVDRVVSIRDGKTSTETVRQAATPAGDGHEATAEQFEELVVLDSAGRLQIPPLLREEYNIGGRVRLHPTEGGILIQPVAGAGTAEATADKAKDLRKGGVKGWRRWFGLPKR
jgi:ABC-type glutathione transport system ATPase component